jgi:hypothetical protein
MARMLGRYETPGCCPGRRSGWTRNRKLVGPDCWGGGTDKRWAKRQEQRALRAELDGWRRAAPIFDPTADPSDCAHGCNGDCETWGSDRCTFLCHPAELEVLAEQWAERTGYTTPAGAPDPSALAAYFEHIQRMREEAEDRAVDLLNFGGGGSSRT